MRTRYTITVNISRLFHQETIYLPTGQIHCVFIDHNGDTVILEIDPGDDGGVFRQVMKSLEEEK